MTGRNRAAARHPPLDFKTVSDELGKRVILQRQRRGGEAYRVPRHL
jgi:hypothetical protein